MAQGLYPTVLGAAYATLSPLVRAFHSGDRSLSARGVFRVEHSRWWFVRMIVRLLGFPPPGENVALVLRVEVHAGGERWLRNFGGVRMESDQWLRDGRLVERLGGNEVTFALEADGGALVFRQVRVAACVGSLRLPMPRFLSASVSARVVEEGGALRSDIVLRAPVIGLLIRYGGRLELDA